MGSILRTKEPLEAGQRLADRGQRERVRVGYAGREPRYAGRSRTRHRQAASRDTLVTHATVTPSLAAIREPRPVVRNLPALYLSSPSVNTMAS